ncbi:universal stress protein [Saccharothrix variisporea]|uniref:Nucleotide-binding universal stress UspA family protein n=1 Tax=Saccharothrix variisporea TaxID=543527 RepID=A0A495XR15_9PSEU|nr:universal stress protein [Saccharothrix variisporea]RKT74893.1 nucleotide-binding universal stress UspA family protein [Saccharothrix variisporea]
MDRPVVVGVDGSTSATAAVRWAAAEAARLGVPLSIVHACLLVPARVPDPIAVPREYHEAVLAQGRQWLAEAEKEALGVAPELAVSTELLSGDAAEVVVGRSASARLVVLGSRGLGGFTGLLVGSIAVALATHGHCPVVVVRGTAAQEPVVGAAHGPVVVGADGSLASPAALAFAFEHAAATGAELVAVRTWSDVAVETGWLQGLALDWAPVEAAERESLEQEVAPHRAAHPEVVVRLEVVRDRPAHCLVERSREASLVVVGSRGRGGFRGLLLGSTSQALIHHAACPVAVVPHQ